MNCTIQIGSAGMIYVSSFKNTGEVFEVILRFWFSNLKDCNVGITDGRDYKVHR
jgi:hypothetical protein